jgi:uncharacterized membrane protein
MSETQIANELLHGAAVVVVVVVVVVVAWAGTVVMKNNIPTGTCVALAFSV